MKKIPTLRSHFSFEQFEEVLRNLAHEIAIEAVTKLPGEVLVKSYRKGRLSEVKDGKHEIRFYASHISYSYTPDGTYSHPDCISFDVEEKIYLTSDHCTKISFFSPEVGVTYDGDWHRSVDQKKTEAEKKKREKKILEFVEKLMADANIKPVPRFSLKQMQA